jgi:uncharacterized membrane protein (UPF0127 family)
VNFLDVALGLVLLPVAVADSVMSSDVGFSSEIRKINGRNFTLYLAGNPLQWQQGFKGKKVNESEAMLFTFGSGGLKSFWMKDTVSALDIIFLDSEFTVTKIVRNAKPCRIFCRPYFGAGKYVLELAAGTAEKLGIVKGSAVKMNR